MLIIKSNMAGQEDRVLWGSTKDITGKEVDLCKDLRRCKRRPEHP